MSARSLRLAGAAVTLLLAARLGPATAEEAREPDDGLPRWEQVEVAPDWVEAPPPREGFVRVLGTGRSNLRELAYPAVSHPESEAFRAIALADARRECARRLRPVLGHRADVVVDRGVTQVTLARRAFGEQAAPGPSRLFGCVTVWALWDLSLEHLLAVVPEPERAAAKGALSRPEWIDIPWHEGPVPAWVARPEVRPGHAAVLVAERAASPALAKAELVPEREQVVERLIAALLPVLGSRSAAHPVARTASTWRVARARTVRTEGREGIAWAAWDVPLAPILERVPEADRPKARAALERVLRSD